MTEKDEPRTVFTHPDVKSIVEPVIHAIQKEQEVQNEDIEDLQQGEAPKEGGSQGKGMTTTVTRTTSDQPASSKTVETTSTKDDPPRPAQTTTEEDRVSLGQRRINLIWEITQSLIAVSVVLAGLYAFISAETVSQALVAAFFTIIGFYFGRTNHQKVGGVGSGSAQAGR